MDPQFPPPTELLVAFFKIAPFGFSILLRISGLGFDEKWKNTLNEYESALDHDLARDKHEWKYKRLTTYIYDKTSIESALRLSFFYAALLHFLALLQSAELWLAVPTIALIALGFFLGDITDRFFQIGPEQRNPDRYYNYYYDGENQSDITRQVFENSILSSWSQTLSPRITSVGIELCLLAAIIVLELAPKQTAVAVSTVAVGIIVVLGRLLFP